MNKSEYTLTHLLPYCHWLNLLESIDGHGFCGKRASERVRKSFSLTRFLCMRVIIFGLSRWALDTLIHSLTHSYPVSCLIFTHCNISPTRYIRFFFSGKMHFLSTHGQMCVCVYPMANHKNRFLNSRFMTMRWYSCEKMLPYNATHVHATNKLIFNRYLRLFFESDIFYDFSLSARILCDFKVFILLFFLLFFRNKVIKGHWNVVRKSLNNWR
jgi:hypothetical protein